MHSNKRHIVFASFELHPINKGGCGVFIWNAVNKLLEEENIFITVLLDVSLNKITRFNHEFEKNMPTDRLKVLCLSEVLEKNGSLLKFEDFKNIYLWNSYRFYVGLKWLNQQREIDLLEFFDYVGIGYFSVLAHKYENEFPNSILCIRAHCTIDLMDFEQKQNDLSYEKIIMYQMEKEALKASDYVLVPSKAWEELYSRRYNIDKYKIIISQPPLIVNELPQYSLNENDTDVLYYGRLFELKGVELFLEAAITYLEMNPSSKSKFYLVGYAGKAENGETFDKFLYKRIPDKYKESFIFSGQVDSKQLTEILKTVAVAVFPNYIESFCYSIHELYSIGVPIICSEIPAFEIFKNNVNCVKFDGGVSDLSRKIKDILQSYNLRLKISYPYPVLDARTFKESYYLLLNNSIKSYEKPESNDENKISLIIFEDTLSSTQLINEIGEDKNNYIDFNKSYYLTKRLFSNNQLSIYIFGERWYIKPLNSNELSDNLPLNNYYWVGRSSDVVNFKFLENAKKCLDRNDDLNYIGAFYIEELPAKKIKNCIPLNLVLQNDYHEINDILRLVIRNTEHLSLRELFDIRLSFMGQKEHLSNGYIIPDIFIELKPIVRNDNKKFMTMYIHRLSKFGEWNPFILYRAILQKSNFESSLSRKVYQSLRNLSKSRKGNFFSLLNKFLDISIDFYKSIKK